MNTSADTKTQSDEQPRQCVGKSKCRWTLLLIIAVSVFAADIVVKHFSFDRLASVQLSPETVDVFDNIPHDSVVLVPKVLQLSLTLNHGAVFGLGQGYRWIFIFVGVIAVGVIGYVFARSDRNARWFHTALALVLGGAMGNLYDRVVFGAVRDMFWIFPGVKLPFGLHWPGGSDELYPWIFNLADAALCSGIVILFIVLYFSPRPEEKKQV